MGNKVELTQNDVQMVINRIKNLGWVQGTAGTSDGPACLIGHINRTLGYTSRRDVLTTRLAFAIGGGGSIIYWNDAPGRTREEVYALLTKMRDQCPV